MLRLFRWLADPWKIPSYIAAGAVVWFVTLVMPAALAQQMLPPWQQSAMGCAYNAAPPALTSGWAGWVQCDSAGSLRVTGSLSLAGTASNAADDVATSADNLKSVTYPYAFDGTTFDRLRTINGAAAAGTGALAVHSAPTSVAGAAATNASSTAAASNLVLKASAGNLYSLTVTIGATSGYLLLFDATSLPSNGAVTPIGCWPVSSNGTNGYISMEFATPKRFGTGITAGFSTTGCFTLTASATGNFFGAYQ